MAAVSLGALTLAGCARGGATASSVARETVTAFPHERYWSPTALSASGPYVWVIDSGGGAHPHGVVYRVTAATGQRVAIESPLLQTPDAIYASGPSVWIANESSVGHPGDLLKLDVATRRIARVASRGVNGPIAVTSGGPYLWLLNANGGSEVTRIDTATGAVATDHAVETAGEDAMASDRSDVWVGGARLLRITPSTFHVVHVDPSLFTDVSALVSDGTYLWALQHRRLYQLDIATGVVTSLFNPRYALAPNLATNGRFVWMADAHDRSVLQLDVATLRLTSLRSAVFSSPHSWAPFMVASDGSSAWVTITCDEVVNLVPVACGQVAKLTP